MVRFRYIIHGVIQGVGFRPFLYRLAVEHHLKGFAFNSTEGVILEIEGSEEAVRNFEIHLKTDLPPAAKIVNITKSIITTEGDTEFRILPSRNEGSSGTIIIPPDIATCDKCFSEMNDPLNRRFKYPFTNCTDCGPRYTIIRNLPYDRNSTTMSAFGLCDECRSEYENPLNRRFHAEPNACPKCGPSLSLFRASDSMKIHSEKGSENIILKVNEMLEKGNVIAVKGLGGFHIVCDADNNNAVKKLRSGKKRPARPLAVMSSNLDTIEQFAYIKKEEAEILAGRIRPIVLLKKNEADPLTEEIAPCNGYYGVMLPYTPLHDLLLQGSYRALVMTSANNSGEPIISNNDEALDKLRNSVDYILCHDREILVKCDDSVAKWDGEKISYTRISRGIAPLTVKIASPEPDRLAAGAELKNTFCLVKNNYAYISGHIGDLEQKEIYDSYCENIKHLQTVLGLKPEVIIHDMHPDYLSTRYAQEYEGCERTAVQHHHAHILSAMAEYQINDEVIGIALDGTGYGTDKTIWGGEILIADRSEFTRFSHFEQIPLPGGDAAAKEPWRMALSCIQKAFPDKYNEIINSVAEKHPAGMIKADESGMLISSMVAKGINSPLSSSAGRLFAAVSALLGLKETASYEGEAESVLEWKSSFSKNDQYYPYPEFTSVIPTLNLFRCVVDDYLNDIPIDIIGRKFHNSIIELLSVIAMKAYEKTKIRKIVLTGGVFQNMILLQDLREKIRSRGLEPITHGAIPTNDAGISLGQAYFIRKK